MPPGEKIAALHSEKRCPRTGACRDGHAKPEQRATTDPAVIERCWSAGPFNIGIATGPSGLVVIDLDTRKTPDDVPKDGWNRRGIVDGHDVFAAVCQEAGQPVPWETRTVRTARGGTHLYFRTPSGVELRSTEGDKGNGLGWKVDTRAWGHVVGPGSVTRTAATQSPTTPAPPDCPAGLVLQRHLLVR
ncbi:MULTISPECIES: bifunctional DNA primase/polymerase [Saccharothrix]|uniref:bifunctional DNA primase/polymerase n=1 Tax=Saccharothrix TaxID=2071 RepID=UPI001F522C22|nr:bifunctional DNA primase/polymerase [Saccharothrix sp. CB00851]